MARSIESLPPELQEEILGMSLEGHDQQHMPIDTYGDEMNQKADLLRRHMPQYNERLDFDPIPLADTIRMVVDAMIDQENTWKVAEESRDEGSRFWFSNKKKLYNTNLELSKRLPFKLKRMGREDALITLKQIATSKDDGDAIDDGRRFAIVLEENRDVLAGSLYSDQELDEMIAFLHDIENARNASMVDRTSLHHDRILRDKIYLYLCELENEVYEAADGAFVHEPQERARYVSQYMRAKYRKYDAKRNS